MKCFKAAIFDLDGTLLDTLGDLCAAANAGLSAHGYPEITKEQTQQRVGNGIRKLIERSLPEGTAEQTIDSCLADFRAHYEAHLHDLTYPYEGIPALLGVLRALGVKVAVLSNKYDPAVQRLMSYFFPGLIDLAYGERPGIPRKPDPSSAREVLEKLDTAAEDTLYIGDSGVDMQTAKNAGLTAAGVTWGFRDRETLLQNGADFLIEQPAQLLAYFIAPDQIGEGFRRCGFGFSYFETAEQAVSYLKDICKGKNVGSGGSITLEMLGAYDALSEEASVQWHWRGDPRSTSPDVFLTSANALALTGEVVNLDGSCNRVAASIYGSDRVCFVCGLNKLAPDLAAAVSRTRGTAAPKNAQRLKINTPCAADGKCHDCRSPERICRALTILLAPSTGVAHTEIILIGQVLGY